MPTSYWSTSEFTVGLEAGDQNANVLQNAIVDVDGDSDLDLVSSRFLYPMEDRGVPIEIMLNDGTGGFVNNTDTLFPGGAPTTVWPRDTAIADYNGDGRPDLYIADHGYDAPPFPGAQNRLFLSSGAHTFINASDRLPQVRDFTHSATAADIDGDGDIDLLAMNIYGGTPPTALATSPYFLINDGTGHFVVAYDRLPSIIENRESGNKYTCVLLFDADGDGDKDLLLGSHGETAQNVSLLLVNAGTGNFSAAASIAIPPGPFVKPGGVMDADALDLNGDGALDLVLTLQDDYQAHYIQILINDGNGHFIDDTNARLPQSNLLGSWSIGTHIVDFNNDGFLDLVSEDGLDQPFFLNDGTGHFIPLPAGYIDVETFWKLQVFDANGDGREDVLAFYGKFAGAEHYRLYTRLDGGPVQSGDAGANALLGDVDAESFSGLSGSDVISAGAGNDALAGGDGNDTLIGGAGADQLRGEAGNDVLIVDSLDTVVDGGTDIDTVNLTGTGMVFNLGYINVEIANGTAGNDQIDGSVGTNGSLTLNGLGGNDTLTGGAAGDSITGGDGTDGLFGNAGNDTISGGIGTDFVNAGDDNDLVNGGDDNDGILAGLGNDTVNGDAGNDGEIGGSGNDSMTGGAGNDYIVGDSNIIAATTITGLDTLVGDADSDTLIGGYLSDSLNGGLGNDALYGDFDTDVNAASNVGSADTLIGGAGTDFMVGGGGNDSLVGDADSDTLIGGSENDTMNGGEGSDSYYGKAGVDTFVFSDNWGIDGVWDFADGSEIFNLTAVTGLTTFGQLTITDQTVPGLSFADVAFGANHIYVVGVAAAQLTAADFLL